MSSSPPLANPAPFVDTLSSLSRESISIDETVGGIKRQAEGLVNSYYNRFQIVSGLKTDTESFNTRWVEVLLRSRDAASAIAGWYRRFSQVFLSLVSDIQTEQDLKDVVTEFKSFLAEDYPSNRFDLDRISGLKEEFKKIEALVPQESNRVIQVLESATGPNWKDVVKRLQDELVSVKDGCQQIERAFIAYASNL
ncbi:hypothetical protein FA13DRAFT_1667389 [Coprinellus micaceus]|uniref:Uncharacterized protein n=1 Tax=Coprinellus micaceus TaxID=71717 RepID=A0A4Y7SZ83_COPMI|nr:hypothetical protein FA13DRAFT_1667389 [Coprinellus micaceus]